MACSVHIRRFVAVLLCCVLAFHSALPVARAAEPVSATLAITAGQIATAGLSGTALLNLISGPVETVVGVTMEGLGTSVYTSEQSAMSKTEFIASKIALWCYKAGKAKEDFYKTVASGISVAANGTIQLGKAACNQITEFINWLYSEEGEVVAPPSGEVEGYPYATSSLNLPASPLYFTKADCSIYTASGEIYETYYLQGCALSVIANWDGSQTYYSLIVSSDTKRNFTLWSRNSNKTFTCELDTQATINGKTVYYRYTYHPMGSARPEVYFGQMPYNLSSNYNKNLANVAWTMVYGDVVNPEAAVPSEDCFTGTPETWAENKDLLNPQADQVTTLTPDLINSLLARLGTGDWTMDIAEYLEALKAAFNELTEEVAKVRSKVTGIEKKISIPSTVTEEVTVVDPVPDPIPVIDPVELNPSGTIEGFSFPLDEIFPFCIPFDVVAALELFDVPAEAPSLHVHWVLPYNIVFDFDLDLSAYDDIAALLRVMETILFAVGLAVATRSLYIRS